MVVIVPPSAFIFQLCFTYTSLLVPVCIQICMWTWSQVSSSKYQHDKLLIFMHLGLLFAPPPSHLSLVGLDIPQLTVFSFCQFCCRRKLLIEAWKICTVDRICFFIQPNCCCIIQKNEFLWALGSRPKTWIQQLTCFQDETRPAPNKQMSSAEGTGSQNNIQCFTPLRNPWSRFQPSPWGHFRDGGKEMLYHSKLVSLSYCS